MRTDLIVRAVLVTGLVFALLMIADPALAQTTSSSGNAVNIGTAVQNIINLLNNNVTRGLAIIAIILAGVAWMFGHLDMRRAGMIIIGIIVVFGASTIVDLITGASSS
jgi:type IV secretory pathway VirB2 component (pilin)